MTAFLFNCDLHYLNKNHQWIGGREVRKIITKNDPDGFQVRGYPVVLPSASRPMWLVSGDRTSMLGGFDARGITLLWDFLCPEPASLQIHCTV